MGTNKSRRSWIIAGVTAVSAALALAAFGSSAESAGAPSVDVWAIVPGADAPQIPAGVQAAFRYVDSHGGVGKQHQQVVVKLCDSQDTAPGEIQCGQQAASDAKSIAVVAPVIISADATFTSELSKAHEPIINDNPSSPADYVNPINFPLWSSNFAYAACAVMTAKAVHATRVAFAALSVPASINSLNVAIAGAKRAGLTVVGHIEAAPSTTDLAPFVRQLQQDKPQVTVLVMDPPLDSQWLSASAQLGASGPMCTNEGLVANQSLAGDGAHASQFYTAGYYPDPSASGYPELTQFRSQAAAEVKAGNSNAALTLGNNPQFVEYGWLSAQPVVQAAANVNGVITRATFLAALNRTTVTFGKGSAALLPPLDFAKPNSDPKYTRLFNTKLNLQKWDVATKVFEPVPGVAPVYGDKLLP